MTKLQIFFSENFNITQIKKIFLVTPYAEATVVNAALLGMVQVICCMSSVSWTLVQLLLNKGR